MKYEVIKNLFWRFAERSGAQIVSFIVSIVLARILEPDVYGTVALISVFTSVMQVFIDSGLGNALIQKKDADDIDFSSVFYFNIAFCLLLYALMFVSAPYIAAFYEDSSLTAMVRVLSLTIIVSGVKNIQQAYISKKLEFKKFFFATIIGTLFSAVIGITFAYQGAGAWALIIQNLTNIVIDTVVVWFVAGWKPTRQFSFSRIRQLFSFGWKMLASGLIDNIYGNISQMVIGKTYSSADLAYYNKGRQLPNIIVMNFNSSIDSVLFPVMSNVQDDISKMKSITRKAIMTSNYVMAPLMMGLAFLGETIIRLLLTEKWLFCVPYLRIFCVIYTFQPIHTANTNAIKAMGKGELLLRIEVIKKVIGFAILFLTMKFGVLIIAYGYLFNNILNQIINSWPNWKLLNYSYIEQIKDIMPSTFLAVFMGVCVYLLGGIPVSDVILLPIQILVGMLIYIAGSILLKLDSFYLLLETAKKFLKRN